MAKKVEYIIGLETHVQLNTESKLFCSCRNVASLKEEPQPNTYVCDVCLGMPGTKPFLNERVVEYALKVALALNCKINPEFYFSRKVYFYPDLAKNYQITQYEIPVGYDGYVMVQGKKIRIKRVHIEEDPAKIVHKKNYTLIDYNRSGVPLLEIVTEPDLSTAEEAREYLFKLKQILEYIGVYDSTTLAVFKSDANISVKGHERVEVKNITGIKEVEVALKFEMLRQKQQILQKREIKRETRRWDEAAKVTKAMRTKEEEEDYGYILDGDLPVIAVTKKELEAIKAALPELPDEKLARFVKQYGLSEKAAESLVSEREIADLFEKAVKLGVSIKEASTWIGRVLKKILNYHATTYKASPFKDEWVVDVVKAYEKGEYSDAVAEQILRKMFEDALPLKEIVKKYGFKKKLSDEQALRKLCEEVASENPKAVEDYKQGNTKALDFLVGKVMAKTRGSADPKKARELLKNLLKL
ncbi:MAG: Asp-tRNA(Asn)/Glu-tRNA(Gln) amidotransferase subunit GatB [Candidatus Nanohaloarchaeota archaeon]|nr:Asp-tRNA(Asn)/Glu-tRNA(Gln) amidotransferase subunit GatB [Candidatus Nanohaloarchaeota archaeon]